MFKKKCRVVTVKLKGDAVQCYIPQEKTLWWWRNCTIKAFDKDDGSRIEIPVIFSEYQNAVDFLGEKGEG